MIEVCCSTCGATFAKRAAEVKRTKHHCCSQKCAEAFRKQASAAYHGARASNKRGELTQAVLKSFLEYDALTGVFTRVAVAHSSHAKVGDVAGSVDSHGYLRIYVDGRQYKAHRLAWMYLYGSWPLGEIDHIDHDKQNNAASNLRDVPRSVNQQNRASSTSSTSGLLGVISTPSGRRYVARIRVSGLSKHLGVYRSSRAAHLAYVAAKRLHHEGNTL